MLVEGEGSCQGGKERKGGRAYLVLVASEEEVHGVLLDVGLQLGGEAAGHPGRVVARL